MINISERAARQIKESMKHSDSDGMSLRVAARRLADGTLDYAMGFDHSDHNDSHGRSNGIDIVVGPTSTELLRNADLDYVQMDDGEYHFIFRNPNDPTHSQESDVTDAEVLEQPADDGESN